MPFEPQIPNYLSGTFNTKVTDPHGVDAGTIISMTDDWHLQVSWKVQGTLVPLVCGKWHIRAYLESIGPGPEVLVANRTIDMSGNSDYSETFFIGPNVPNREGPYKLVTVMTSTNKFGKPAPFAAYDEGPILQFFQADTI